MVKIIQIINEEFIAPNECLAVIFADSKEELSSEYSVSGLPTGRTLAQGSKFKTADGSEGYLKSDGTIEWVVEPSDLPPVDASDNGKVLVVEDGQWAVGETPVTPEDIQEAVNAYCAANFSEWAGGLDSGLTQPLMAAPADKVGELKSALSDLRNYTGFIKELINVDTGGAIKYSDGSEYTSYAAITNKYKFGGYVKVYAGDVIKYTLRVVTGYCIIAFFTSPSVEGYVQNKSVEGNSDTMNGTYTVSTDGYVRFTTKNDLASHAYLTVNGKIPTIEFDISELQSDVADLKSDNSVWNNIVLTEPTLPAPKSAWIKYSNGEQISSSATNLYVFHEPLPKYIKAFLTSDTNVLCAIAFYSSDGVSTDGYLSDSSVDFQNGTHNDGLWYEATVPSTCKTIAITTKKPSESVANPIIKFDCVSNLSNTFTKELNTSLTEINDVVLSDGWKYIYHFGMEAITDRSIVPVIPSQSVFDIRNANNLGYKCIEANVHKTSDNKYVVTHGVSGALGHDFNYLNGEDAYGISISENTLAYLRENFAYRSSVPEYRVPITTLEEFCHEAKKYNMIVMFQYKDATELAIIKGIMGTRFFLYVGQRSNYDGPILEYLSYSTKAQILERCQTVGRPYIYSMGNVNSFTDEELQDIINTLHQNGFYIATAYNSGATLQKLSAMGFDFFAVGDNYVTREVILDGKKLIFNIDGSVSWVAAEV